MQENIYRLTIECRCPKNPEIVDSYQAEIKADHMITVEDLQEQIDTFTAEAAYQEDLTEWISKQFDADVTLTGIHSGVQVSSHHWPGRIGIPAQK